MTSAQVLKANRAERWTASRKQDVLDAIRRGELTAAEACDLYGLSLEELDDWRRRFERHGQRALKAQMTKELRA